MSRYWIVDGHNVIFAVGGLNELQISDRREEAREALIEALRRFARTKQDHLLVVFDAGDQEEQRAGAGYPGERHPRAGIGDPHASSRHPRAGIGDPHAGAGAGRGTLVEVVYARRDQGGADERIIREAKSLRRGGHSVTVVTNDVLTLAAKLPKDIDHLKVRAFWQKHIEGSEGDGADKRVEGDFSDLEKEMLARADATERKAHATASEPGSRGYAALPGVRTGARAGKGDAAGMTGPATGHDARGEVLRLKKERGRARHQRRFKRS